MTDLFAPRTPTGSAADAPASTDPEGAPSGPEPERPGRTSRATAALTSRLAALRERTRFDDDLTRTQLAIVWGMGGAVVVASGLIVAAIVGGSSAPALTTTVTRMVVLPGFVRSDDAGSRTPPPRTRNLHDILDQQLAMGKASFANHQCIDEIKPLITK